MSYKPIDTAYSLKRETVTKIWKRMLGYNEEYKVDALFKVFFKKLSSFKIKIPNAL